MKKKWLIGLIACLMAVAMTLGFVACNGDNTEKNNEKTDAEIAQEAIDTVKVMYADKAVETPNDYDVIGQTKVGDDFYTITWTVTAKTENVNISDYVTVGPMNESTKLVTIGITRGEIDVEYTLTASVKVNEVTESVNFEHKVPATVVVGANDVGYDFSSVALGSELNADSALALLNSLTETEELEAVTVSKVYQGYEDTNNPANSKSGMLKLGSSSANGVLTLTFKKYISKVVLEAQGWGDTDTISVNGADEQTLTKGVANTFTFEFAEPTTEVAVTFAKRGYLLKLVATFAEGVHNHVWQYEHVANSWNHTKTCTAAGCDLTGSQTEECAPSNNVCKCGYTYTENEILEALFALAAGDSLPGTYELTGKVKSIDTPYDSSFKNVSFTITVGGRDVLVYRVKGEGADTVKVGDTVTVQGELTNFSGKYEFTSGCTITDIVDGSATMSDKEKVEADKEALDLAKKIFNEVGSFVELPATGSYGTAITWAVETNDYIEITDGKLTVKALPESDATVKVTATLTSGTETATKEIVVTVSPAFTPENDGSETKPFTVAEVIKLCEGLAEDSYYGTEKFYVKGFVVTQGTYSSEYGNFTGTYIADTKDGTDKIQVYRLTLGTVLTDEKDFVVGAEIVVYGYIQNFKGDAQVTYKDQENPTLISYKAPEGGEDPEPTPGENDGTIEKPYTVAEALALANGLADGAFYQVDGVDVQIHIKGYVTDIGSLFQSYGLSSVRIADEAGGSTTLLLFTVNWGDAMAKPEGDLVDPLHKGDFVVIYGFLKNYKGTIEVDKKESVYPTFKVWTPVELTDEDKIEEALAAVDATMVVKTVGEVELPVSKVDGVIFVWTTEDTTYTIEDGKLKVPSLPEADLTINITVTASCNDMKKEKQVTVTIKVPEAVADNVIVFDFSTASKKTGTKLDADTALELFNEASNADSGLISVAVTNIYDGTGSGGAKPDTAGILKSGTGSASGQIVLTFDKNVTKIVINCHDFYKSSTAYPTNSNKISVNNSEDELLPYNATGDGEDMEFVLATPAKVVTIDLKDRAYIYKITVFFEEGGVTPAPTGEKWVLVEDVSTLYDGAKILFVYDTYVNGALYSSYKYLTAVDGVEVSADKKSITTLPDDASPLTLGKSENYWTFTSGDDLIGLTGVANNSMAISGSNLTTTWTVSITDGVAMIASTLADETNTCRLQCNTNDNQQRFANYKTSTQHDPSIYILVTD